MDDRRTRIQTDVGQSASEEPSIESEDTEALSLDPRYTALPTQQGGEVHEEEVGADPSDLGRQALLGAMAGEQHDQEKNQGMPEQLVERPDDTAPDRSEGEEPHE